jgi:hypothetical protein
VEKAEAEEIYAQVRLERAGVLEEMRALERRLRAYDRLLGGYAMLFPELDEHPETENGTVRRVITDPPPRRRLRSGPPPRGQDAVLAVLQDPKFRGRRWTVGEMTEELFERDWKPDSDQPNNAVRAALNRLRDTHPRVRRTRSDDGMRYWYVGQTTRELMPGDEK